MYEQGIERRGELRRGACGYARLMCLPDGPEVRGTLSNLCAKGCAIDSEREIAAVVNNQVEVRLEVEGFQLRLLGVVRHLEDNHLAGIEFVELSSRKVDQIEEVMKELASLEQHRKDVAKSGL